MTVPARIYDAKTLTKIADFYRRFTDLVEEFQGPDHAIDPEYPVYIFSTEIVIRHTDGYTIGRIGMDDNPFFEITDEKYGEKTS